MQQLSADQLNRLFSDVFPPLEHVEKMVILVDIPNDAANENTNWKHRRRLAYEWSQKISSWSVHLAAYPAVEANNADLPGELYFLHGEPPDLSDKLPGSGQPQKMRNVFIENQLFVALTQFSATAPLKIAAAKYSFRAATMPGFSMDMIPALKLDYNQIGKRVTILKTILDAATGARIFFHAGEKDYTVFFDLRHRSAHESSGRFPFAGTAGNLPSGETYIVPHEGEKGPSQTRGVLPVQFNDEIVLYEISNNRAVAVLSTGQISARESTLLVKEPAYGNMAELGFGVLADFGIQPIGQVLLDEKLGFHIAFGRSDHFGGIVGPAQFSSPQAVVHIDRIYISEVQPGVNVKSVICEFEDRPDREIIKNGKYCLTEFEN
ncbi:hypothetical protein JW935_22840 [candidate division KSB1 bacterium]|nr:hypothetical protein [candidate division KSB1 bacterium]